MTTKDQSGSVASFVAIFILSLVLAGALAFGFWAYHGRQDYKNNSDQKSAVAVEAAKKVQADELQKAFADQEKQPFKIYKGPTTYGTVSFNYPRTWSAYDDQTNASEPLNGYFYPDIVPGIQSKTAYALRLELVNTDYSSTIKQHDTQVKDGTVKVSAYVPPKMVGMSNVQPGTRLDGALDQNTTGSMVVIKVRDKTLKIYTQSNDFLKDFNDSVLSSLTFAP